MPFRNTRGQPPLGDALLGDHDDHQHRLLVPYAYVPHQGYGFFSFYGPDGWKLPAAVLLSAPDLRVLPRHALHGEEPRGLRGGVGPADRLASRQPLCGRRDANRLVPMSKLFPTTLVGSYAQPDWLIDRAKLAGRFPPRVRAKELWRVAPEWLERGAGRRDASWPSATRSAPASTSSPTGRCGARATRTASPPRSKASTSTTPAPPSTAAGTPTRSRGSSGRSAASTPSRCATSSSSRQHRPAGQDDRARSVHDVAAGAERLLRDDEELALDYAAAVNEEIKDLFAAGADVVQIDEPYMQARPDKARRYGVAGRQPRARRRRRHDRPAHLLRLRRDHPPAPGGLLVPAGAGRDRTWTRSRSRPRSRTSTRSVLASLAGQDDHPRGARPERRRGRDAGGRRRSGSARALAHVPADRVVAAPDCGLKYLPRDVAFGKMTSLVQGAAIVRDEVAAATA